MGFMKTLGLKRVVDGRTKHILYLFWKRMMQLTYERDNDTTKVDTKWHNFWAFAADMMPIYEQKPGRYICRFDAAKDWTLGNVRFVNTGSALVFGRKTTHKLKLHGVTLSTSQAKRVLQRHGIEFSQQTLTNKVAKGDSLLSVNQRKAYIYDGRYQSLKDIAKQTGCDYPVLKYHTQKHDIDTAIKLTLSKLHRRRTYHYKGKTYNQSELAIELSKDNPSVTVGGMKNRLKKGLSIEQCLKGKGGVSLKPQRG